MVIGGLIDPKQGVNGVGVPDPNNATDFFVDKFIYKEEEFGVLIFAIDGSYKLFSPMLKKVTIPLLSRENKGIIYRINLENICNR